VGLAICQDRPVAMGGMRKIVLNLLIKSVASLKCILPHQTLKLGCGCVPQVPKSLSEKATSTVTKPDSTKNPNIK